MDAKTRHPTNGHRFGQATQAGDRDQAADIGKVAQCRPGMDHAAHRHELRKKVVEDLAEQLNESIQAQAAACNYCPNHCLKNKDARCSMFDDPFYSKPLSGFLDADDEEERFDGNDGGDIIPDPEPDRTMMALQAILNLDVRGLNRHGTARRAGPVPTSHKIGRNDPCPCGSGNEVQEMLREQ